jgi:hypothetical protein
MRLRRVLIVLAGLLLVLVLAPIVSRYNLQDARWRDYTELGRAYLAAAAAQDDARLSAMVADSSVTEWVRSLRRSDPGLLARLPRGVEHVRGAYVGDTAVVVEVTTEAPVCSPHSGPDHVQFLFERAGKRRILRAQPSPC